MVKVQSNIINMGAERVYSVLAEVYRQRLYLQGALHIFIFQLYFIV